MPEAAVEFPDLHSASLEYQTRFCGSVGAWLLESQEKHTYRGLDTEPNQTLLDVGGGHGQLLEGALRRELRVTVFGSSERCMEPIREAVFNGRCKFEFGNLLQLPYPDQSFDHVFAFRMMGHLIHWEQFLSELCRVARKTVIINYAPINSFNVLIPIFFNLKLKVEKNTRRYSTYRQSEINAVFEKNDFRPEHEIREVFLPIAFHRALKWRKASEVLESIFRGVGLTGNFGSPIIATYTRNE